jgi:hypothetical protein
MDLAVSIELAAAGEQTSTIGRERQTEDAVSLCRIRQFEISCEPCVPASSLLRSEQILRLFRNLILEKARRSNRAYNRI